MTGSTGRPRAVLFDLLTALIDSAALWDAVAGGAGRGRSWRAAYLRKTYAEGAYRPYQQLVRDAASEVGLPEIFADQLVSRYGELLPWPEVGEVLGALGRRVPLAVVTNCSEALGQVAVARTGIAFDVVVTAERAGYYKPHCRPYRLALEMLGEAPENALFVAGSPYDLFGAAAIGMPVFWHNRMGMTHRRTRQPRSHITIICIRCCGWHRIEVTAVFEPSVEIASSLRSSQ